MKFGLLTYDENRKNFNIGDYIQSLAAKQFLPQVDSFINREELASFRGERTKVIMNGWFTHNARNWIPSEDIDPFFISFHINNTAAPLMLSTRGVAYLKEHEPIGCRDHYTVSILREKDIDAYFSGCLTLTLDSYKAKESERTNNVYLVDPLYGYPTKEKVLYSSKRFIRSMQKGDVFQLGRRHNHLKKILEKELVENAVNIEQELSANKYTEAQKFTIAEDLLHKYARAKLVITSRIHCALPCLALGTPVVLLNGFENFVDSCRMEGILELFNRVDVNTNSGEFSMSFPFDGKIGSNIQIVNPTYFEDLAEELKKRSKVFVASD